MKLFILLLALVFPNAHADEPISWSRVVLCGGTYTMMGFAPPELRRADVLNIFIEGDGMPGVALAMADVLALKVPEISRV